MKRNKITETTTKQHSDQIMDVDEIVRFTSRYFLNIRNNFL
jgi:hypothetical protein